MIIESTKEPHFSQPTRQTLTMFIIVGLVSGGAYLSFPFIEPIIKSSPYLNWFIVTVFVIGLFSCFWQMWTLTQSVQWIEGFALDRPGTEFVKSPRLLAPLASMLRDTRARRSLTSSSTRSILDSVATRLDEARDITRYIVNLLIFLGLLGTFFGLATTVPAVVDTIRTLAPQDGQSAMDVFGRLMAGLEDQLGGMGTAFASSLLGLTGSLVVGLLELFAGHGQNRFYMELEEWLSSITRISLFSGDGEGGGGDTSGLHGLAEETGLQLETLKDVVLRGEEGRQKTDASLARLAEGISEMTYAVQKSGSGSGIGGAGMAVLERIAQSQTEIARILRAREEEAGMLDGEARARLRNIDVQLLRILEEMSAGRQDSIAELRADLAQLSQAVMALANARKQD